MRLDRRTLRALALATQLGTSVAASVGLPLLGGYLLDRWLGTEPVFLLAGVVVGLVAAWHTLTELGEGFGAARSGKSKE